MYVEITKRIKEIPSRNW